MSEIEQAMHAAGVVRQRHVVLEDNLGSSLHSGTYLEMSRLLDSPDAAKIVTNGLARFIDPSQAIVPVSREATELAKGLFADTHEIVETTESTKGFFVVHRKYNSKLRSLAGVVMLESQVETADRGAAMVRSIRGVLPGGALPDFRPYFVGIWRRGDVPTVNSDQFLSERYLVEKTFSSWAADACLYVDD